MVAGGANFPEGKRPWEEGVEKIWHDRIFVFENLDLALETGESGDTPPEGGWREVASHLPRPIAYGVSLSWQDPADGKGKIVCLGGGDAKRHFADAFLLLYAGGAVTFENLPPLPRPVANACGALIGDTVYLAGGIGVPEVQASQALKTFWSLDLSVLPEKRAWNALASWPGDGRMLAVAGAHDGSFFLFSGSKLVTGRGGLSRRVYLQDAFRYAPRQRAWTTLAPMPRPAVAAPTPAFPLGSSHLLVFGGDSGAFYGQDLKDLHPGFPAEVLAYDAVTDTWASRGGMPKVLGPDPAGEPNRGVWPPVTTATVERGGAVIVANGEVRPGVRTSRVLVGTPRRVENRFGTVNWSVLVIYLAALVGLGLFFSRRETSTSDFFVAGRRVPWWAAGLSIYGTQLSAITYLAIPAKAYQTNWTYFIINLGIIAMAPVVVFFYLPFYRRLGITSAYEYLELRFNVGIRLLGSALFVTYQVGRMAVVVLLPSLALSAVTGIDVLMCIAMMGVLSTFYTAIGGIEAVVWTDVLQVIVLIAGAAAGLILVVNAVPGGFGQVVSDGLAGGKLSMVRLEWDWAGDALGVILLAAIFNSLVPYTSDQAVIQRYLTTPDEAQARRAIWTNALMVLPTTILFFGLGTALWVYYREYPALIEPLEKIDQIVPWFIATEMPAGLAGLVIAGVFAASMSSLDSSMHSCATAITTDFVKRFRAGMSDREVLRFAQWLTVGLGVVGTVSAMVLARSDIRSLWDTFIGITGLFLGTLGGLFSLGIFTRRAGGRHAMIGVATSAAVLIAVKFMTELSGLLYAAIGLTTCWLGGWLASLLIPSRPKELGGLTAYAMPIESGRRIPHR